jgi:hypothetical protein
MNREQAKQILQAQPPAGDDSDPQVRAALEFAASDADLMRWFREQQALDQSIQQKLKNAPPPEGLVAEIVGGWKERSLGEGPQRSAWPKYLALAAAVVLLAGVATILWSRLAPRENSELAFFRTDMAGFLKEFPQLDAYMEGQSEVRRWLTQRPVFSKAGIPARLQKFPAIGCRQIEWRGKSIALICLVADGEIVHLFLIPGTQNPTPSNSKPQWARAGRFTTATWPQSDLTYVLMTPASREFLQKLL